MQPRDFQGFEQEIGTIFNDAQIKAPIHLHGNNEKQLIEIFKTVRE